MFCEQKLYETNELVATMKVELVEMEPQLKIKSEATAKLMKNLIREKAQADEVRQVVVNDEAVVKVCRTILWILLYVPPSHCRTLCFSLELV